MDHHEDSGIQLIDAIALDKMYLLSFEELALSYSLNSFNIFVTSTL